MKKSLMLPMVLALVLSASTAWAGLADACPLLLRRDLAC